MPPPHANRSPPHPSRIALVDSLRGWLAWIVLWGHAYTWVGYDTTEVFKNHWFLRFMDGGLAVMCFFCISGFSVTWSVIQADVPFSLKTYFSRRFFRIYPLYFAILVASGLLAWRLAGNGPHAPSLPEKAHWHWLIHLFMCQGILPDSILNDNAHSLLGVAWSLGVEEQFYFFAPWVLVPFLGKKYWKHGILFLTLITGCWMWQHTRFNGITIANYFPFFAVGISCAFLLCKKTPRHLKKFHLMAILALIGYTYFCRGGMLHFKAMMPLIVWGSVFSAVMLRHHGRGRLIFALLENKVFQWLGKCSYSTYLLHILVFTLIQWGTPKIGLQFSRQGELWWLLLVGGGITLALSSACYLLIERPLIHLGRRIEAAAPSMTNSGSTHQETAVAST